MASHFTARQLMASRGQNNETIGNELLQVHESFIRGVVEDRDISDPSSILTADLVDGNMWIVAITPAGDWQTFNADTLALWLNSAWINITLGSDDANVHLYLQDEKSRLTWDGSKWLTWDVILDKTADFTVAWGEAGLYVIDATSGDIDITLPEVSGLSTQDPVKFIRTDATTNTVTLNPERTTTPFDSINGSSSDTIPASSARVLLPQISANEWHIIGSV